MLSAPSRLRAFSVALSIVATFLSGCDSQDSDGPPLTAEIVGGEGANARYLAGTTLAVELTNHSSQTLGYDVCGLGPTSEATGHPWAVTVCVFAPQLREIGPGEAVLDSHWVPRDAPAGRYRYVFPTYTTGLDRLGDVTTEAFEVVAP